MLLQITISNRSINDLLSLLNDSNSFAALVRDRNNFVLGESEGAQGAQGESEGAQGSLDGAEWVQLVDLLFGYASPIDPDVDNADQLLQHLEVQWTCACSCESMLQNIPCTNYCILTERRCRNREHNEL